MKIHGRYVPVRAEICSVHGLSAHADADGLLRWLGTATRTMILGGRVMVEEVTSQMMGQPFNGHGMHGFDNTTGKYWATWNDNMGTGLMVSEGTCDTKLTCTYTGSYHDPVTKKAQTTRMTTRWTDKTTELFEMYGPGPDGKETKMMEITYKKRGQ